MSKNNEKKTNSHHQDSNVNSQAKNNINSTENSCGCGCDEDSKSNINSAENSCDIGSKNEPDKQDTCEIGESCSTCGCEEGLLEEKEQIWDRKPLLIISTSAILLVLGLYLDFFKGPSILPELLFLSVIALSGYEIIKNGIKALLKGNFTMNFLMTIAVLGSFLIGSGAEGAVVIFLFYIALYLENYAGEKARKSIAALLKLAPDTATVKKDGKNTEHHVHDVMVGDIIVVKPGDKIPLDGIVVEGISAINQAAITGESMPVTKTIGDDVFAGTLNEEGYLEIEVTKRSNETVLSKIVELVKESQKRKSNTENFIDKLAKYYTPAVILIAAIVATVPVVIFGLPLDTWVYRALVLIIISCPCAFLLSTPVAMVSGITASTKNGVLIKGSKYIEEMQKIKVMVFDKTGTLTQGELEVTDIINLNNHSSHDVLSIAGSLESKSKHPLAEAVMKHVEKSNIELNDVKDFESITGKGLKGKINGEMFYIGKKSLFKSNYEFPDDLIHKLQNNGKTAVLVGNDKHIIGLIGLRDKIRDLSESTVQELKNNGIKTVMLTGDNDRTAKTVAENLGIDEYYAELLPEDKVRIIDELLTENESVAMVGDGVNDAPALARSNVGIAMGAAGSDVAIETADIALMHDDISKINYLIRLSKKTMNIVKQNVAAALLIQISLAVFAVFGFVSLWMAVTFGDMGLTLAVILNALRIGRENSD
ncbi:MAG: cation-translocating P-type ATPase [Methanobacteriaceae archaeon]|nr:cation-translocating P-type ATPase [Methanobacteriaceae archaeon]